MSPSALPRIHKRYARPASAVKVSSTKFAGWPAGVTIFVPPAFGFQARIPLAAVPSATRLQAPAIAVASAACNTISVRVVGGGGGGGGGAVVPTRTLSNVAVASRVASWLDTARPT